MTWRIRGSSLGATHVCHQASTAKTKVPARRRHDDGTSVARVDGACVHGARADARQSADALRGRLRAEWGDDEALDAGYHRRRLRRQADPETTRAVPRSTE